MELNLNPQKADATLVQGEGGGYYAWTAAKSPVLATTKLGAGKLVLQPRGFAFPHFADTFKIAYVMQGECTVGLVAPNNTQEKVVIIKKGDAIPVPMGFISWWFNGGDSDTAIIFLGESSQSYNPGLFDYYFLAGAIGILQGFSTEFVAKIYGLSQSDAEKLVKSQTKPLLVQLGEDIQMPCQSKSSVKDYVVNLDGLLDGQRAEITADNFPLLDKVGLSADLVRAKPGCVADASYGTDASRRIFYVIKGGGRVQISGLNGAQVLDAAVEEEEVFVVPQFFAVAIVAGENGMEFFCVTTSARPVRGKLTGNTSAWKALSAPVLQATLNGSPEFVKLFKSKIEEGEGSCK